MRSGTWSGASTTDNVRVTVNGTVRPVKDVSIQSGMKDGHPAAETSSWCIEATIEWADPKTVTADSPHPFGGGTDWLPQVGDDVVIETGDGALGQWWVQHVGVIDDTSGSIKDGTAVSRTVDDVEELNKPVQYVALLSKMTPYLDGEGFRYQGLSSMWYVDRVLRDESSGAYGWHATPPMTWQTVGLCTGLGSVRPEVGTVTEAHHRSSTVSPPSWGRGEDGMPYPWSVIAHTLLSAPTRDLVLTLNFPTTLSGAEGLVYVLDEAQAGCVLGLNGEDRVYYGARSGTGQANYSVPRNGASRAALHFERISATSQTMTLRLDDGREFTSDTSAAGAYPENWQADRVTVDSNDGVGWWMVEDAKPASQRWFSLEHVPTARIRIGPDQTRWHASRDQPTGSGASWLEEQLDAEGACMWLDEDGHMQWAGRGVLEGQSPALTVTGANLDGIDWQTALRRTARRAVIKYTDPRIDVDAYGSSSRELWSSDNIDLAPGEVETVTVTVPSEEDWIADDTVPHHVYQYGQPWDHYWRHSTFGGTQYRKSNTDEAAWCQFIDCTMTKTGLRDFEVTFSPWSSISSVYRVNSSWPPSTTSVPKNSSPLVMRGRAKVTHLDREKSLATGHPGPPRYVLDVGWRVQDVGADLDRLLEWLRDALANPMPTATVTVAHDPRRQIGDKIRVEDRDVTGTWVEMLVQERDTSVGGFTDTVRGRVTAHGDLADVSLLAPRGATPTTPMTTWNREVAS